MTGFRFVDDHQADYRVTDLCRVAGVSRSGFYAWTDAGDLARSAVENAALLERSARSTCSPAAPTGRRVCAVSSAGDGRRVAVIVSPGRCARDGLVGAHARRKWRRGTTPGWSRHRICWNATSPPQLRICGGLRTSAEFRCIDGKLYLAGIRDLYDHTLVGWSMGERQTTDLVVAALVMALGRRPLLR